MEDGSRTSAKGWSAREGGHPQEQEGPTEERIRWEMERTNARLRHFRGVAASVMHEALGVWEEIWEACGDPRTCEEILDGLGEPAGRTPAGGWDELRQKLHLLRHHMDYAKRLCEGSIDKPSKEESEV